ncbi:sugar kinase [Staphylococcus pseudoxylosus]|uniref:Sugar kinase n=1 Tax=Staphylococcus pseudoxylosus TaxID=2282419 RepID=A0AAQ0MIZ6_9STAP|nr:sugar kinase [Staphylococcus pseudoxylosus]PTI82360.1 2-dehydro-3-deoxygluconokinase [Staphylococcus xylosus]MBM2659038.1 sugar kinase [Staphylococcus pseudoxylosus]MCE5000776.1 sugar kinase [Staphylococcus pseudoxylosus]MEB5781742.1 sugar kinase [Staphylococcus pseudoxylosus]RMI86207.1 sugar kinase [Staphylococcus pseudoxylosus]
MNKHIAAYGEIMMRLEVPDNLLLRQAENLKYSFTGTGVNVTGLLSQFGYDTSLISAVPENSIGTAAIGAIRRLGIHSDFIIKNNDNLGMYFLEQGFGNRPSNVTYTNRQQSSFNTTDISEYDIVQSMKGVDVLHICGISLAMNNLTQNNILTIVKVAKEQGIKIVFDCNFRPSLWGDNGNQRAKPYYETILREADIVIMSEKDAINTLNLTTTKESKEEQLEELLLVVAEKFNIDIIAGTIRTIQGSNQNNIKGYLFKNGTMYYSEAFEVNILDRIGTGDAYTCGVIHGELSNMDPQEMVTFSTAACVLAHTISGDTPLFDTDDIIKIVNEEKNDIER